MKFWKKIIVGTGLAVGLGGGVQTAYAAPQKPAKSATAKPSAKPTKAEKPAAKSAKPAKPVKAEKPAAKSAKPAKPAKAEKPAPKSAKPVKPAKAEKPAVKSAKPAKEEKPAAKSAKPAKAEKPAAKSAKPAKPAGTGSRSAAKPQVRPGTPAKPAEDPMQQLLKQQAATQAVQAAKTAENDEMQRLLKQQADQEAAAKAAAAREKAEPARKASSRSEADELIASAMGLLGVAYRFGGTSPTQGLDCSGFMQYVFRKSLQINLPRTSAEQARMGVSISRAELQPGDMVFFNTTGRNISHVGLYIGNNRFIHAPRTGKNIEITSMENSYWAKRYVTARRVKGR